MVCTFTSGPSTSPTHVTSCPESSSGASSSPNGSSSAGGGGALLALQTPTQVLLKPGMQEPWQSSPAQGWRSPSTSNWGNPGRWQLGFYRHHAIDLWVLGRWKLQDFALGERAEARRAICEWAPVCYHQWALSSVKF